MTASWTSPAVRATPPPSPSAVRSACACAAPRVRPMRRSPASVCEGAHPHAVGGQPVPQGEQEPGDEPQAGLGVGGQCLQLRLPERAPVRRLSVLPVGSRQRLARHRVAHGRAHEPHPVLHPAVVEHPRGRGHHQRGPSRTWVRHQPRASPRGQRLVAHPQRPVGGEGLEPVAAADGAERGGGPGGGVHEDRLARFEDEGVGRTVSTPCS